MYSVGFILQITILSQMLTKEEKHASCEDEKQTLCANTFTLPSQVMHIVC